MAGLSADLAVVARPLADLPVRLGGPTCSGPVAKCYHPFSISLHALLLLGALALFVLLLKVHHQREAHGIRYGAIEASSREKVGGI